MNRVAGGASAVPFNIYLNHSDTGLFMRVVPEIYLKVLQDILFRNVCASYPIQHTRTAMLCEHNNKSKKTRFFQFLEKTELSLV